MNDGRWEGGREGGNETGRERGGGEGVGKTNIFALLKLLHHPQTLRLTVVVGVIPLGNGIL